VRAKLARALLGVPAQFSGAPMFRFLTRGGLALRAFDVLVAALIFTALS
jgi:hypothetical protein